MYTAKIKIFISKIKKSSEDDALCELIENTLLYLFNVDEAHANSTLDALLLIAENSYFDIKYSDNSQFMINYDQSRILIKILKDENEFALIHEFEHIIHYYGARQYDQAFIKRLSNTINSDEFIKKVKFIINSNILPIIYKCIKLVNISKNKNIDDIIPSIDDANIRKHMIEEEYDSEILEFVLNSRISFEEYVQLSYEEDSKRYVYKIMEKLYPSYFYFYGLITNIMQGRVIEIMPNIPFAYGHPRQYFEQNDDIMWFSEIIATYEEIRATKDIETINQLLKAMLGAELYYNLIAYSDYHRELTINNLKEEKRNVI